MRKNLPYLTQERLDAIFNCVYDDVNGPEIHNAFREEKLSHLLKVLKTMQRFNLDHRPDDRYPLFALLNNTFSFEPNSQGTDYWLALILAVKELYGFPNDKLVSVMQQVSVRK